jgi:hypothetical protein
MDMDSVIADAQWVRSGLLASAQRLGELGGEENIGWVEIGVIGAVIVCILLPMLACMLCQACVTKCARMIVCCPCRCWRWICRRKRTRDGQIAVAHAGFWDESDSEIL